MTTREREDKIARLQKEYDNNARLVQEKRDMADQRYREVQDFTKADSVSTDSAIDAIRTLNSEAASLEKKNIKIRGKILDLTKGVNA